MSHSAFQWSLGEIAEAIGARLVGGDALIHGVSTDTRHIASGELFVALRGERFDGHQFISRAAQAGAAAIMVDAEADSELPQLVVQDTRLALGAMASAWRGLHDITLIAVTGSNGKTTVKEMIAAIAGVEAPVLATQGNLNNDIGVPLTLLRLRREHRFAVIEMGANHAGEIAYLTRLAQPDVALVNNAGAAHLEGFGSLEGVARAKGEIYEGLSEAGVAVINHDDAFADLWRAACAQHRCLSFALHADADITAHYELSAQGAVISLHSPQGECRFELAQLGEHNVMNALAASAAALAAGCALQSIRQGMRSIKAVPRRLQLKSGLNGSRIIDDTYNANPTSLGAALNAVRDFPGIHYLALGDMGELGGDSQVLHADAGAEARDSGIAHLYTLGDWAAYAADSFGEGARRFDEHNSMVAAIKQDLSPQVTLLVKGSRSAHMDKVVDALVDSGAGG